MAALRREAAIESMLRAAPSPGTVEELLVEFDRRTLDHAYTISI
jgi:hypothetical protein